MDAAARNWLAHALREEVADLPSLADDSLDAARLIAAARHEGVAALIHARLACGAGTAPEQGAVRAAFADAAREQAARSLRIRAEVRRLLDVLHAAGVQVLVLKGVALAEWLYPAAHLRSSGDFDVLVGSREDAQRVCEALAAAGYPEGYAQGRHAYEAMRTPPKGAAFRLEVDVHWRLLNAPVFANVLDFRTLWAASIPLSGLGPAARGLCPVHALAHAAMNRVVNLYTGIGDLLKCLYDIHLLASRFESQDWEVVVRLGAEAGLCGVLHSALDAARGELGSRVPETVLDELARRSAQEALDASRLGDWAYMQYRSVLALRWRERLPWIWGRLVPDLGYLRNNDGPERSVAALLALRCKRLFGRILPNRCRPSGKRK